jgi:hypothetical protein
MATMAFVRILLHATVYFLYKFCILQTLKKSQFRNSYVTIYFLQSTTTFFLFKTYKINFKVIHETIIQVIHNFLIM